MNKVVIVDDKDQPIGLKTYDHIEYEDIYRVSALWLKDTSSHDVLITQRKWSKHIDPGKWMAAASGTIEEGEDYDENIVHEIEEEIGLSNLSLTKGPKQYSDDGQHKYFVQWYLSEVDKNKVEIVLQEDEVEAYEWVDLDEVIKSVSLNPEKFVAPMKESMQALGLIET
jgi:isopentenyl-diphosphate delta-isomerase